jgi:hypothetical protein
MDVTARIRPGYTRAWPLDRKLSLWLASLAALTALNIGLWIALARSASLRSPYAEAQLLLSGVYVAVCGFRSLVPRVDLERVCVWDSWLSSIMLGRTAATVAELCFALQCGLFVYRLADVTGTPLLSAGALLMVPLAFFAQLLCWYAVLSLNPIGHAIEESLWALIMLLLSVSCGAAAVGAEGTLRTMLLVGFVVYLVGACLTMTLDVGMYIRRWRAPASAERLTLATGLRDCRTRRLPTPAWHVWREEVPWMTLYFSVGVWTSLAMVLLDWA